MAQAAPKEKLDRQLRGLCRRAGGIDPDDLVEAVEAIIGSLKEPADGSGLHVYAEIESLASFIAAAKREIAEIRADEIKDDYLPMATGELAAVVGATEQATNAIFEAVEKIEGLTQGMEPKVAEEVTALVTSVYEACSFQDITGQRIGKVVSALEEIDNRVEALLKAFGDESADLPKTDEPKGEWRTSRGALARPDEVLLNGPQLEGEGISQSDVDELLGLQ